MPGTELFFAELRPAYISHTEKTESSIEINSPAASPKTATLMEGLFPREIMRKDTQYTQATLASCSTSWEAAGTAVFLMP